MDLKQSDYSFDQKKGGNSTDLKLDASHEGSDQYSCPRCEQTVHLSEKDEHEDWHFAKDLEAQEQDGTTASTRPAQAPPQIQPPDFKQAGDSKGEPPPDYAPPSYPPPQNGASRATATRHHTNQVIEAAKIRARDEVTLLAFSRDRYNIG